MAAAISGGLAVSALWPTVAGTVAASTLRAKYVHRREDVTKLVVLDTRLMIQIDDEAQLRKKLQRLKAAAVALAVSVVLVAISSIVTLDG
jgi:hypothetical protein